MEWALYGLGAERWLEQVDPTMFGRSFDLMKLIRLNPPRNLRFTSKITFGTVICFMFIFVEQIKIDIKDAFTIGMYGYHHK